MTQIHTPDPGATSSIDATQQRQAVIVARLIGSIAEQSTAGRLAARGQLVALGYARDEIDRMEHDATRMLHALLTG